MQNSLTVVNKCVGHLARLHIPNTNRRIARTADDDFVVVLETQHGTCVTCKNLKMHVMSFAALKLT